jgi:hypothetical protein
MSALKRGFVMHRVLLVLFLSVLSPALAQANAGKFLFVAGTVTLERTPPIAARVNDSVVQGDTVATAEKSRAQLLMNDGARIALRSGTRLTIDEFALPAAVTAPVQAGTASAPGRAVSTLLKGGFRTTTGAIGKGDPSAYAVRTPVGTLGIRGTRYVVVWCANDCGDAPGILPGTAIPNGLYLAVEEGVVVFQLGPREIRIVAPQVLFIPADGGEPRELPEEPAWLRGDGLGAFQLAGGGKRGTATPADLKGVNERRAPAGTQEGVPGTQPPTGGVDQPIQGTDADGQPIDLTPGGRPQTRTRDVAWSLARAPNLIQGYAGAFVSDAMTYVTNGAGNLTAFDGTTLNGQGQLVLVRYELDTSTVVDAGVDAASGIRWGRWTGANFLLGGTAVNAAQQSLAFVLAPSVTDTPAVPQIGTVTYTLSSGPPPTDGLGNVGTLGSATLVVDFTNQVLTNDLVLTVGPNTWAANGPGVIGAQLGLPDNRFAGIFDTVTINAAPSTGNGIYAGFFAGPAETPLGQPAGAGFSFNLVDPQTGLQVNGAAVLNGP